jgi:uncharacterized protein (TIGR00725 family)
VTSTARCIDSVTFFGCACGEVGDPHFDGAYETAKLIASSGRVVVNGGGPGVMLAATVGAQEVNGKTTAVYYRPELADNFKGEVAANFADKTYEESNYILRTKKLLELGDAFVVFNGGTGTISEFAMAWGVARLYIDKHKPLILYGEFWEHLMADFKKHMLIRPDEEKVYTIARTPKEVMEAIDKYEKILNKDPHSHKVCKGEECRLFLD